MLEASYATRSIAQTQWRSRTIRAGLVLVMLVGAGLRISGVERPLDHRLANAWRSSDYTQIARNFYREGMNPFYPRIDWRGDTPGYVEMEFPLLPWLGACLDCLVGYREDHMRFFACAFSLASLLLFARLSGMLLAPVYALFATAAFALNPLLARLGNAMQPEPVMIFFAVAFAHATEQWRRSPTNGRLFAAAALLACAALAKPPAAVLGLVLLWMVLRKQGRAALVRPVNYLAAILAAAPPTAWVLWSRGFWNEYGNSLGVSNESHWLSLEMLAPPFFLLGNFRWETLAVWTPLGWALAVCAAGAPRRRTELAWSWYLSICLFYVLAGGTSGDDWASYYHCASVPAACLLMGAGLSALCHHDNTRWHILAHPLRRRAVAVWLVLGVLASLSVGSAVTLYRRDHQFDLMQMRRCALEIANFVPQDESIIVRGGDKYDEYGRPVAYNEPMMFAWMDRKGFNYARGDASPATFDAFARRGARFWIANADELKRDEALRAFADKNYMRVATCSCRDYTVFDLHRRPGLAPHGYGAMHMQSSAAPREK